MNFQLTEEHQMIREMTKKFADDVVTPQMEELDRTGGLSLLGGDI